jgi:hypothetical protein
MMDWEGSGRGVSHLPRRTEENEGTNQFAPPESETTSIIDHRTY